MPDERRHLAVRAAEGDTLVDTAREVRDAVLEIVVRDLHDIGLVLDDRAPGGAVQLAGGVAEAVVGDDGVGVDDEDDLAYVQRPRVVCPRPPPLPALLERLLMASWSARSSTSSSSSISSPRAAASEMRFARCFSSFRDSSRS